MMETFCIVFKDQTGIRYETHVIKQNFIYVKQIMTRVIVEFRLSQVNIFRYSYINTSARMSLLVSV